MAIDVFLVDANLLFTEFWVRNETGKTSFIERFLGFIFLSDPIVEVHWYGILASESWDYAINIFNSPFL